MRKGHHLFGTFNPVLIDLRPEMKYFVKKDQSALTQHGESYGKRTKYSTIPMSPAMDSKKKDVLAAHKPTSLIESTLTNVCIRVRIHISKLLLRPYLCFRPHHMSHQYPLRIPMFHIQKYSEP